MAAQQAEEDKQIAVTLERGGRMAERTCLKCGEPFVSRGRGNRLCSRCAESNVGVATRHEGTRRARWNGRPIVNSEDDE